jgi:myo-inositol-1(or 4)-monophosphatase
MKRFITQLTRKVGKFLLKNFRKDYSMLGLRGVAKEVVTKYDRISDEMIVKAISKKYPDYNIMTEESGFKDKNSEFTWMVDSLDGSSNFAVGNPFFSVSIALLHYDKPILGVIYAPFLKEMFIAEEGKGTLLNGKIAHVSGIEELSESYILSCEGGEKNNIRISRINSKLHPRVKDLRKLGSAALESAWVACGRAEAYLTTKIDPWDVAAGVIIVEEAGGKITDFKENVWKPIKTDVIMSNSKIHNKILSMIRK